MCLAQGPQQSDSGEAQTRGPSVSSQALCHGATSLPTNKKEKKKHLFIYLFCIALFRNCNCIYNLSINESMSLLMYEYRTQLQHVTWLDQYRTICHTSFQNDLKRNNKIYEP